eukprot:PhM_4_TR6866/c0_g1_i1/m.55980
MNECPSFQEFVTVTLDNTLPCPAVITCSLDSWNETRSTQLTLPSHTTKSLAGIMVSANLRHEAIERRWHVYLDVGWVVTGDNRESQTIYRSLIGAVTRRNNGIRFSVSAPEKLSSLPGLSGVGTCVVVASPVFSDDQRLRLRESEVCVVRALISILTDTTINPRSSALPLHVVLSHLKPPRISEHALNDVHCVSEDDWLLLLKRYPDTFSSFTPDQKEINARNLQGKLSEREVRIMLKPDAKSGRLPQFTAMPKEIEDSLKSTVTRWLRERGTLTARALFRVIPVSRAKEYLSPAFSVFLKMIQKRKLVFWWSSDPGELSRVGLLPQSPARIDVAQQQQTPERLGHSD